MVENVIGTALRCFKASSAMTLLLGGLAFPSLAHASLRWSSPKPIDRTATGDLISVACPSIIRCVAVDFDGQRLTFNPYLPGRATHKLIDPGARFGQVVCPSTRQCTAIDDSGRELTFNPRGH